MKTLPSSAGSVQQGQRQTGTLPRRLRERQSGRSSDGDAMGLRRVRPATDGQWPAIRHAAGRLRRRRASWLRCV